MWTAFSYQQRRLRRQHRAKSAHHGAKAEQAVPQAGGKDLRGKEIEHLEAGSDGQLAHQEEHQLQRLLFTPSEDGANAAEATQQHEATQRVASAKAIHDEQRHKEAGNLDKRYVSEVVVLVAIQEHNIQAQSIVDQHMDDPAQGAVGYAPFKVAESLANGKFTLLRLLQLVSIGYDQLVQRTLRQLAFVHFGCPTQYAAGTLLLADAEQPANALGQYPEVGQQYQRWPIGDAQQIAPVLKGLGKHGQGHFADGIEYGYNAAGEHPTFRTHQLNANDKARGVEGAAGQIVQELKDQKPNIVGRIRTHNAQHGAQNAAQCNREAASIAVNDSKWAREKVTMENFHTYRSATKPPRGMPKNCPRLLMVPTSDNFHSSSQ